MCHLGALTDQEFAGLSKMPDLKESVKTLWRDLNPSPPWSGVSLVVVCESGCAVVAQTGGRRGFWWLLSQVALHM